MAGSGCIAGAEIKEKYIVSEDMFKGALDRLKITEEELKETTNSVVSLKYQLSKRGSGV